MATLTADQLTAKKCVPCEGGVPKLTPEEAQAQLSSTPGWVITSDNQRIRREWTMKNFIAGLTGDG